MWSMQGLSSLSTQKPLARVPMAIAGEATCKPSKGRGTLRQNQFLLGHNPLAVSAVEQDSAHSRDQSEVLGSDCLVNCGEYEVEG
jgi:hypothetical protein